MYKSLESEGPSQVLEILVFVVLHVCPTAIYGPELVNNVGNKAVFYKVTPVISKILIGLIEYDNCLIIYGSRICLNNLNP